MTQRLRRHDFPQFKLIDHATFKYQLVHSYTHILPLDSYTRGMREEIEKIAWADENFARVQVKNDVLQLYCRKGYAWNGANWPAVDTVTIMRGSLVHDAFCQLINDRTLDYNKQYQVWKVVGDNEFNRCNLEDRMHPLRAKFTHLAVRRFAVGALT